MKCDHCGKNEVSFVYRSNINGVTEERRLCGECAEKLGYTQRLAASHQRMMESFFDDSFFGGLLTPMPSLLGRMDRLLGTGMMENPFDDFFADMPALTASPAQEKQAAEAAPQKTDLVEPEEQGRFAHMRQMNALRMEMKKAVRQENFERAAELRDQIRDLEARRQEQKKDQ